MSKIALIAKFTTAPGRREEMAAQLEKSLAAVQGEAGTEMFVMHNDASSEDVLWMYEVYTDGDALNAHASGPATAELMGIMGTDLLAAPPEMFMLSPRAAKGLDV